MHLVGTYLMNFMVDELVSTEIGTLHSSSDWLKLNVICNSKLFVPPVFYEELRLKKQFY